MTEQPGLFTEPAPAPAPPADTRSTAERRRDRMADAVALGQHPLSVPLRRTIPLHPVAQRALPVQNGPSCGTCVHRRRQHGGNRAYPKCTADGGRRATHGEATDCRTGWPGCDQWEAP